MNDLGNDPRFKVPGPGLMAAIVTAVLIAVVVALLHGPAVSLALTGDSYQWVQLAHHANHQPFLLFSDLDTFFRPSTTWSLVADRFYWGGFDARGYRTTSLVLHGLVALALAYAGRRLGLGPIAATLVALVWVTSPFTDESAFVVACRHQPLLLLPWLVLIASWPRKDEPWSVGRIALTTAAILAAVAAKETWVVTPALVAALEFNRRKSLRETVVPTALVGIAAALYTMIRFLTFPTSRSYFEFGPHILARIPQQLAAFLYLRESSPFVSGVTWEGLLAVSAVVLIAVACLRWRVAGTWVALSLLIAPTLPTLLVPYMPQRFLAIPYAGFLLLVALWVGALIERLPQRRTTIRGFAVAIAALVMVAGAFVVRADLEDYRAMAAAHEELLREAAEVPIVIAEERPVLIVREERAQPLVAILKEPEGIPKLPFTRHEDPYGLIDSAALFEWVLSEEGTRVESVDDWVSIDDGAEGAVIAHHEGGFIVNGLAEDVASEAARLRARQVPVRVVRIVRPEPVD